MPSGRFKQNWLKAVAHVASRCHEGSWPYRAGQDASIECTSWCAVAVAGDPPVSRSASRFLVSAQNKDGGWSNVTGSDPAEPSDWSTGLALLALRLGRGAADNVELQQSLDRAFSNGISFLMNNRTELYKKPFGEMAIYLMKGPEALAYPRGWPWTPGCFHWVEPTSYALMAIKPSREALEPALKDALGKAQGFLLDHACEHGGWNHGNNICLSVNLPPYTVTTAEALIALQDLPSNPLVAKGLAHLEQTVSSEQSLMALSWCAMALDALEKTADPLLDKLVKRQRDDGSFSDSIFHSALATCALAQATTGNPLKFTHWPSS